MFSGRSDFEGAPHDLAVLRARLIEEGEEILDLTESNPTRCGFVYPEREIIDALADPGTLRYEPDPRGLRPAREALARWLSGSIGAAGSRLQAEGGSRAAPKVTGVDPVDLVLTASTSEAYAWLMKILCQPGEEILIPRPSYPLFDYIAQLEGVRLARYPLTYDGRWRLDVHDLASRVGPRTRAVIVVHPNNPTGSLLEPEEVAGLRNVCRERGLALIADEVFLPYPLEEGMAPPASLGADADGLTFSLGGLSKAAGLPQVKLAWIRVGGPEGARSEALERLEWIGDTFLSVGAGVQVGLERLLETASVFQEQAHARLRENRRAIGELRGNDAAWEMLRVEAGWSAVLRLPRILGASDWALRLLREDHVYLHPGDFFDFETDGHLVVSLLPEPEVVREAMIRLDRRVRALCG